jgi:hypothetical protein
LIWPSVWRETHLDLQRSVADTRLKPDERK